MPLRSRGDGDSLHRSSSKPSFEEFLKSAEKEINELQKEKHTDWSPLRQRLLHLLEDTRIEYALCVVIVFNLFLLVCEAEISSQQSNDEGPPGWLSFVNRLMLIFFSVELAVRLFTFRLSLLHDVWSVIDAVVISVDIACFFISVFLSDLPALGMLRIVRLIRLTRMSQVIEKVPQLHVIVTSIAGAANTLFWGLVMLICILTVWGILAVELLKPLNEELTDMGAYKDCERCTRAFSSVWMSVLTFVQQIVAGDSWGLVSLPLIEYRPLTAVFFGLVFVSLDMALLNIILASVVDAVSQARMAHDEYIVQQKQREVKAARRVLEACCRRMDKDGNGTLTYEEMETGYKTEPVFRMALEAMDVKAHDLPTVWNILDTDESGDVSYVEFCDQIHKMKTSDPRTMLVFMKYYTATIHKEVHETLKTVREDLASTLRDENKNLQAVQSTLEDENKSLAQIRKTLTLQTAGLDCIRTNPPKGDDILAVVPKIVDPIPESVKLQAKDNETTLQPYLQPVRDVMKESEQSMKELMVRFESGLNRLDDVTACWNHDFAPVFAEGPKLETKLDWLPPTTCCSMKRDTQRIENKHILHMVSMSNESRGNSIPEVIRRGIPPGSNSERQQQQSQR